LEKKIIIVDDHEVVSFRNALAGIKIALRTQRNLRFHLIVGIVVISLAVIFRVSLVEFSILLLVILVVIISEMFNTSIEFTVDLISPEYNSLAKKAKDISAAAVLVSAFFAIIIGFGIFGSKLYDFLSGIYK